MVYNSIKKKKQHIIIKAAELIGKTKYLKFIS